MLPLHFRVLIKDDHARGHCTRTSRGCFTKALVALCRCAGSSPGYQAIVELNSTDMGHKSPDDLAVQLPKRKLAIQRTMPEQIITAWVIKVLGRGLNVSATQQGRYVKLAELLGSADGTCAGAHDHSRN